MAMVAHLRCNKCNRLFGKLLFSKDGKTKVISFKCDRCSTPDNIVYHNYSLEELEQFFAGEK